ncbi:MAG: alpha/beta hydrolase family protein [Oligoflexia bacterium]|nr:alpha/beta hydrolase family protein [Oligoflexia bacterium]
MYKDKSSQADFCVVDAPPESRLSQFERSTLTGGEDLERALNWASRQLESFDFSKQIQTRNAAEILEQVKLFSQPSEWNSAWISDPRNFFVAPTSTPIVCERVFHGFSDGDVLDLNFPSAYRVQTPEFSSKFGMHTENKQVHVRYWRHRVRGCPAIIAVHGWAMGDQRINSLAFLPGLFYQLGFDVALIELPFHGRRKPTTSAGKQSFMFPSMDIVLTNEAMAQVISDMRSLKIYLESDGAGAVGCMGMSLGAYLGVLWASLDALSFCVPIVPMVDMAELAWEIITRHEAFRSLREQGLTVEALNAAYKVHSPLNLTPATDKSRMLIVAGIGDQIVPSRQPKLLWDHWKRPRIVWFQGGHVPQFKRSRTFEEVISFFKDLGLLKTP